MDSAELPCLSNGHTIRFALRQDDDRVRHVLVCAGFLKGVSMKRINFLVGVTLALSVVLCLLGSRMLSAQDNLKGGTVIKRTELKGAQIGRASCRERG